MTRAKELVAETFSAVGTVLSAPLEGCLLEVREAQVEGPGQLASAAWPYDAPHKEGDASAGDLSQAAVSWRQMIPTLKKDFDKHLKDALEVRGRPPPLSALSCTINWALFPKLDLSVLDDMSLDHLPDLSS